MKFIDEVRIFVKAGDGGPGCVSFRRERYVPRGGPDGGDGGRGGNVVLVVDSAINTLSGLRRMQRLLAQSGKAGQGNCRHGRSGSDLLVKVPPGTIVRDAETGKILKDLTSPGERWIAARGGRGGRGNARFKTATRQAPRYAQPGLPGEERYLDLELRLIADVGLIGEPNAGKSTLLARVSSARPKVADYPFTTVTPVLGVSELPGQRSIIIADIPGLIQGAHKGVGMGLDFLRHIERTRVLLLILDVSLGKEKVLASYHSLIQELKGYRTSLIERPMAIALNKVDVLGGKDNETVQDLCSRFLEMGLSCYPVSAITGEGVEIMLESIYVMVNKKLT